MIEEILFTIANILFLVASYPNIKSALKDRNSLKGFSYWGAFLTFLGMTTAIAATYITFSSFLIVLMSIPTWSYWGIVTYYSRGN